MQPMTDADGSVTWKKSMDSAKFKVGVEKRNKHVQERYVYEGKVRALDGSTFDKYRLVKEHNPKLPSGCSSVLGKKKIKAKLGIFKCENCYFTSSSKTSMEALEHKFACGKISKGREIQSKGNNKIKSEEESDPLLTESNHYQPSEAAYKIELENNHDRLQGRPAKIKSEATSESFFQGWLRDTNSSHNPE